MDRTVKIKTPKEQQLEQERLSEILIVLEEMFQREGAAGKRVIGCLYDIAVINWLNKNLPDPPFNPCLKYLARFPRGIAQHLGLKLFLQPKCPKLITQWLYSLVEFPPTQVLPTPDREVDQLKQRVKLLTSSLIITIVFSAGSLALLVQNRELPAIQLGRDQQIKSPPVGRR